MSAQVVPRPCPSPTNNDAPCLATVSDQTQSRAAAEGDTTTPTQQVDSNTPPKHMLQATSSLSEELSG